VSRIAIVTDSVACIPRELVEKYGIYVAPVHITWDRTPYLDGIDITASEFYTRLKTSKTLPTTSSAIQGEFIKIYESLKGKVEGVVTVVLSGNLGAAYTSAMNAKEIVKDLPIEIIDSRTAMAAQAFIVIEAAKAAVAGADMKKIVEIIQASIPRVYVLWAMNTLEYLRRGGRVSIPQALLASWLKVKPIIEISDGKVVPISKTISKTKAIEKMLSIIGTKVNGTGKLHISVLHGNVPEEAEQLEKEISSRFKYVELLRTEITPVIGTHTGPGTLGIAYFQEVVAN
jgi:DegV family protein with EDD domain